MNQYEMAGLAWPILIRAAKERREIFYGELARDLGYPNAKPMRLPLHLIQSFCLNRFPALTILVIDQATRAPGAGFTACPPEQIVEERQRVYGWDWEKIPPPFSDASFKNLPLAGSTPDTYRVEDSEVLRNGRGPYQGQFKKMLMLNYGGVCALCDTRLKALLVAAHVVPWAIDRQNRLNPQNGILLCRTHDTLFENGHLRIRRDLSVEVRESEDFGADLNRIVSSTRKTLREAKAGKGPAESFLEWHRARWSGLSAGDTVAGL